LLFELEQLSKVFRNLVHFFPFFVDLYLVLLVLVYVYAVIGMVFLGGHIHRKCMPNVNHHLVLMNFNDLGMGGFNMFHLMYKGWDTQIALYEAVLP
jgi:hypothetical protein